MKKYKIFIQTSIFLLFTIAVTGQTTVNVITGLHSANTSHSGIQTDLLDLKSINRLSMGIIIDQGIDDRLSVRTGLIYKQNGFQINETFGMDVLGTELPIGVKVAAELNTLEIPLMLQYNFKNIPGITPYVSAGPSFSYAQSGAIKTKATAIFDFTVNNTALDLSSDNYNRFGVNGNVVTGLKIPYGKGQFVTEVGYSHSMTDVTSERFLVDTGLRPKGWSFNIGYGLSF